MGLDNFPQPLPCKVMGTAIMTENGLVKCSETKCPFKELQHVIGAMFGTDCWLRGKVYDPIVRYATDKVYTLYEPLNVEELQSILAELTSREDELVRKFAPEDVYALIRYFETLLGIKEWVNYPNDEGAFLEAWF